MSVPPAATSLTRHAAVAATSKEATTTGSCAASVQMATSTSSGELKMSTKIVKVWSRRVRISQEALKTPPPLYMTDEWRTVFDCFDFPGCSAACTEGQYEATECTFEGSIYHRHKNQGT